MRSLAIAFFLVFASGFVTALVFDRLGILAGVVAIMASMALILLMSVFGAAIAGPPEALNLLMDHPHWRIQRAVRYPDGFSDFFRALPDLAPPNSFLALANGSWDREIREAVSRSAVDLLDTLPALPKDFKGAPVLPISESQAATLAGLADHHAPVEIAMHLAAFTTDGPWLEWFDATGDPISISLSIAEPAVARFADRIRGKWERVDEP